MKRTKPLLLAIFIALALLVTSSFGQVNSGPAAVTNSPYSIVEETQHTRTLADGTHIVNTTQMKFYRDSSGRTRIESLRLSPGPVEFGSIQINDPIADKMYVLNTGNHVAETIEMRRPVRSSPSIPLLPLVTPPEPSRRPQPSITHEDLGTQTIEGLLATGQRTTTTIPVDAQGNDRPIIVTREVWVSDELRRPVYTKISDPLNGDSVTHIVSLDRSEPDPALFQVPPDYVLREPNQQ